MQQISVTDLRHTGVPEKLPDHSQLKVWVRSTGYEVRYAEPNTRNIPASLLLALILAVAVSALAYLQWSEDTPLVYLVFLPPILVLANLFLRVFQSRSIAVRLDLTPMTLAISYLGNGNRANSQEHVPIKEIESFYLDGKRGLAVNSTISEILYRTWIARGLAEPDLYYLACLIVAASKLSMQRPHPGAV